MRLTMASFFSNYFWLLMPVLFLKLYEVLQSFIEKLKTNRKGSIRNRVCFTSLVAIVNYC